MATRRGALATGTSRSNLGPAAFATTLNSSRASTLEVSVKLVESQNPQQRPRDPRETRRRYVLHKTPSPQRDERQELDVRWRGAAPREGRCATGRQCPWRRVASPGKPRKRSTATSRDAPGTRRRARRQLSGGARWLRPGRASQAPQGRAEPVSCKPVSTQTQALSCQLSLRSAGPRRGPKTCVFCWRCPQLYR